MRKSLALAAALLALSSALPMVAGHAQATEQRSIDGIVQIWAYPYHKKTGELLALGISSGTGFIINDEGVVVTNRHVMYVDEDGFIPLMDMRNGGVLRDQNGKAVLVSRRNVDYRYFVVKDGRTFDLIAAKDKPNATVIDSSKSKDIAILQVTGLHKPTPLTITDKIPQDYIKDRVFAIGYPGVADNFDPTIERVANASVTSGNISRSLSNHWSGKELQLDIIQHNADLSHGNSGGPLIDECKRVIGVNTQGALESDGKLASGFYYASAGGELLKMLRELEPEVPFTYDPRDCVGGELIGENVDADHTTPPQTEGVTPSDGAPPADTMPDSASPSAESSDGLLESVKSNSLFILLFIVAAGAMVISLRKNRKEAENAENEEDAYANASAAKPHFSSAAPQNVSAKTVDISAKTVDFSAVDAMNAPIVELLDAQSNEVILRILPDDFAGGAVTVGRDTGNARFSIADASNALSQRHFSLEWREDALWLTDLKSTNGTTVKNETLTPGKAVMVENGGRFAAARRGFIVRFT